MRGLILLEQEVNARRKGLPDSIGQALVDLQTGKSDLYETKKLIMESLLDVMPDITVTHLGEDYGEVLIGKQEFSVSLGVAEAIYEEMGQKPK